MEDRVMRKPEAWYRQPVMWIVVLLPLISIVGGGLMVVLATATPDTEVHSERLQARPPVDAP
jgi:hypothetical protein